GPAAPGSVYNPRRTVPPNDHWLRLTATFRFGEFEPSDTFRVGVSPQEYTANTILGLSETPSWNTDSYALPVQVTVPLTRLPDSDY
ncbi:MAG: hypothetical protein VB093_02435, partial [Propionicimonas sp.]|nr:hypothetical protein [Propionicimonas sp.]